MHQVKGHATSPSRPLSRASFLIPCNSTTESTDWSCVVAAARMAAAHGRVVGAWHCQHGLTVSHKPRQRRPSHHATYICMQPPTHATILLRRCSMVRHVCAGLSYHVVGMCSLFPAIPPAHRDDCPREKKVTRQKMTALARSERQTSPRGGQRWVRVVLESIGQT